MAKMIEGKEHPIKKVFCEDFVFSIPLYQRPYAWTKEEAGELIEDLLAFMGDAKDSMDDVSPYFLGSIVLIKGDGPESEVIDGQQRLTTFTTLLCALREALGATNPDFAKSLTGYIYEKANQVTGTSNRYRLRLRERDCNFFQSYVQNEGGLKKLRDLNPKDLSDSQKRLLENALLFETRLNELTPTQMQWLAKFIINKCFLVVVSAPDQEAAYRIFSVLNDRGLDLSHTDILKAEIIGKIPEEKQTAYNNRWEDIENDLGRDNFKELFVHIRTIRRREKSKNSILVEFRQYVQPQKDPVHFIDDLLSPFADALHDIKTARFESDKYADSVNSSLRWLNMIDNFDWIPPAILYLSKNRGKPEKLKTFFVSLERLASGLMITRFSINDRMHRYSALLSEIDSEADLERPDSALQLSSKEQAYIQHILNGPIYENAKIRAYTLMRLDAELSGKEATYDIERLSVEHVLPQNPKEGSEWTKWFPNEETRDAWIHRLGNLVLLSRTKNSEARNFEFSKKKEKYFASKSGVSSFALTTQVLRETEWNEDVLHRRQTELHGVLVKAWRLEGGSADLAVEENLFKVKAGRVEVRSEHTKTERKAQQTARSERDTIVVPAHEEGFQRVFVGENRWYAIRISDAMKDRIKFIAAYRVAPISAVTHLAEVAEILPHEGTEKYVVKFKAPAREIRPIPLDSSGHAPQGPVYVKLDQLERAKTFADAKAESEEALDGTDSPLEPDDDDLKEGVEPARFHSECMDFVSREVGEKFTRITPSVYKARNYTAVCQVSREYKKGRTGFWFAFSTDLRDLLNENPGKNVLVLGCGRANNPLVIPAAEFLPYIDRLNATVRPHLTYWHIHIYQEGAHFYMHLRGGEKVNMTKFAVLPSHKKQAS